MSTRSQVSRCLLGARLHKLETSGSDVTSLGRRQLHPQLHDSPEVSFQRIYTSESCYICSRPPRLTEARYLLETYSQAGSIVCHVQSLEHIPRSIDAADQSTQQINRHSRSIDTVDQLTQQINQRSKSIDTVDQSTQLVNRQRRLIYIAIQLTQQIQGRSRSRDAAGPGKPRSDATFRC